MCSALLSLGSSCGRVCPVQQLQVLSGVEVKVPYTLVVGSPAFQSLESSWNWDVTSSGTTLTGIVSQVPFTAQV